MPATLPDTRRDTNSHELLADTSAPARKERSNVAGRRTTGLFTRMLGTGYRDPLFERLDLIEDDYHRFLHQPRG